MRVAVGTFTDGFMGGTPAQGIHLFDIDPVSLAIRQVQVLAGLESPSFLARHPRLPLLYAAERRWSAADAATGAIATMAIDGPQDAPLRLMDRQPSGGAFTAHVQISPTGSLLALANPLGPTIAVAPLDAGGIPGPAQTIAFAGIGARPRQSAPWPHSCFFDPQGRFLYVCDLGLDLIRAYRLDASPDLIAPAPKPFAQVASGAGARHLAITPDGLSCHVANELDGTICTFTVDPEHGGLVIRQTLPAGPNGFASPCQPAEIISNAAGTVLYVTLRGSETIGIFAIDKQTGLLTCQGHIPCGGKTPRHIALATDQALALVSNQMSDAVTIFRIAADGMLEPTGRSLPVPSPACCVIL